MAMIAPVLNRPDNPWYQRQLHVRIPKQAESKLYLDAGHTFAGGILSPIPGGYANALLNQKGFSGTVRYGCVIYDASERPYGAFTPATVKGMPLHRFVVDAAGLVVIRFNTPGTQLPPAITTLNLTIEGFGALTATLSSNAYRVTSVPLWTYLSAAPQLNRVIGINGMPT